MTDKDKEKALASEIYQRLDEALTNSIAAGLEAHRQKVNNLGSDNYDAAHHYREELRALSSAIYRIKEDLAVRKI